MKLLILTLAVLCAIGAGLTLILIADLDKAKKGEKSLFWEEKDD